MRRIIETQVDPTMVSGGQARSGWLSRMKRNNVDPDRLAVRMKVGGPPADGRSGPEPEIGASVIEKSVSRERIFRTSPHRPESIEEAPRKRPGSIPKASRKRPDSAVLARWR